MLKVCQTILQKKSPIKSNIEKGEGEGSESKVKCENRLSLFILHSFYFDISCCLLCIFAYLRFILTVNYCSTSGNICGGKTCWLKECRFNALSSFGNETGKGFDQISSFNALNT